MARPLPGLDIIRFAAAAMVMVFHLGYWSWVSAGTPAGIIAGRVAYPELSVLSCGWVGVEIVFVLSGFVIAYSPENASTISFVQGRSLRLAPAAWLCATSRWCSWCSLERLEVWVCTFTQWLLSHIRRG